MLQGHPCDLCVQVLPLILVEPTMQFFKLSHPGRLTRFELVRVLDVAALRDAVLELTETFVGRVLDKALVRREHRVLVLLLPPHFLLQS